MKKGYRRDPRLENTEWSVEEADIVMAIRHSLDRCVVACSLCRMFESAGLVFGRVTREDGFTFGRLRVGIQNTDDGPEIVATWHEPEPDERHYRRYEGIIRPRAQAYELFRINDTETDANRARRLRRIIHDNGHLYFSEVSYKREILPGSRDDKHRSRAYRMGNLHKRMSAEPRERENPYFANDEEYALYLEGYFSRTNRPVRQPQVRIPRRIMHV